MDIVSRLGEFLARTRWLTLRHENNESSDQVLLCDNNVGVQKDLNSSNNTRYSHCFNLPQL